MMYQEAIAALVKGKFVTREIWEAEGQYLSYLPGISHLLRATTQAQPTVTPWAANVEDSIATDWKEVNPFAEKLEVAPVA